jgi:ribosomal protein S21
MIVHVNNGKIDEAVRVLKSKLRKDHLDAALRLRAIPKPSERKKEKARRAAARRAKKKSRFAKWQGNH